MPGIRLGSEALSPWLKSTTSPSTPTLPSPRPSPNPSLQRPPRCTVTETFGLVSPHFVTATTLHRKSVGNTTLGLSYMAGARTDVNRGLRGGRQ